MTTLSSIIADEASPGIVFVRRIEAGRRLAKRLGSELGVDVPFVYGGMRTRDRQKIAGELRAGKWKFVVATTTWSTGINIPAIRWVVRMGAGAGRIGLHQEAGRGSRIAPGKGWVTYYDVAEDSEAGLKAAAARDEVWAANGYEAAGQFATITEKTTARADKAQDSWPDDFELTSMIVDGNPNLNLQPVAPVDQDEDLSSIIALSILVITLLALLAFWVT
jgi:superfamily II DNA helicase RecQ